MITTDTALNEVLKAIASGHQEITPDVQKAIELGLAKKAESAFISGSRLVLTPQGIATLEVV